MGYYAVETDDADATVLMYENLFQIRQPKVTKDKNAKDKEALDPLTGKTQMIRDQPIASSLRKQGAALTVKQAIAKAQGFRLVDMDSFLIGLNDTIFYWLGNDLRASTSTLCFTEVSVADTGSAITKHNPETPLISIG